MEEEIIDEFQLNPDELERQAIEIIESTLSSKSFDEQQVKNWQNSICEQIMTYLLSVERNYKYISEINSQLLCDAEGRCGARWGDLEFG